MQRQGPIYPFFRGVPVTQMLLPVSTYTSSTPPWMSTANTPQPVSSISTIFRPNQQYVAPEQRGYLHSDELERRCLTVEELEDALANNKLVNLKTKKVVEDAKDKQDYVTRDPAILLTGASTVISIHDIENAEAKKKLAYEAVMKQINTIFNAPGKSANRVVKADTLKTVLENIPEYKIIKQSVQDSAAPLGSEMPIDLVAFVDWLRHILPEGYVVDHVRPYTVRRVKTATKPNKDTFDESKKVAESRSPKNSPIRSPKKDDDQKKAQQDDIKKVKKRGGRKNKAKAAPTTENTIKKPASVFTKKKWVMKSEASV